ncbi:MAG: 16S rRNA (guanine(966)-N(2))-methyltransferase RsmD [Eubacteriales bacterium]|nr:16S rRNA (guanine(966)-N(2))-methyltransferase RsmD [Eubacteriales bacterium]MDD4326620.1 16S rRNA (guanine(966)-N(2))-methyltransferase RsmD [Eubacteriales bacterium]MDD4716550.1 16S rRNA (guanine(966)-N(2))-methyltransferase RsmD [Eubacteriales bacterium]NCU26272.1 16S rRNA (guanine(966)-N(2))-methyltransferase RsmD [Candidatus Nomurabacteria bacterium]
MPRVISGSAGGRALSAPNGSDTRPTSDRAKEALFSILGDRVSEAVFLDLFSGTGQIAIEALSRGAAYAVLVDSARNSIRCIKDNIGKCGFEENSLVVCDDVLRFVRNYGKQILFDLVYIDPPYADAVSYFRKIGLYLDENTMLNNDAIIVLEHDSKCHPDDFVTNLKLKRCCKYGTVMLSFYERYAPIDESCSAGGSDKK